MEHQMTEPSDCNCGGKTEKCPVCDWGFGVCKTCGLAEGELDDHPECLVGAESVSGFIRKAHERSCQSECESFRLLLVDDFDNLVRLAASAPVTQN